MHANENDTFLWVCACSYSFTCMFRALSYSRQPDTSEDPMSSDEEIYFVPWTRCPVYFMGLLLGFVYYKLDNEIKLPKVRTHCRHDCLH